MGLEGTGLVSRILSNLVFSSYSRDHFEVGICVFFTLALVTEFWFVAFTSFPIYW